MDDGEEATHHVVEVQEIGGGGDGVMDPSSSSSSHAKKDDKNGKEEKEERSSSSSEAHEVELLINIELEKVGDRSWLSDYSIYRLPETLVDERPEAYIPHRVSIGPIYHGYFEHLKDMEARKMLCLDKFLKRERPGAAAAATTLSDYIKAVRKLEEIAYQCYPEEDANKIERNRFVMMMVVDGCFILELLLQYEDRSTSESDAKWSFLVSLDLILVENQLPIFVLEALYGVFINAADAWTALYNLICNYFVPNISVMLLIKDNDTIDDSSRDDDHHIQQLEKKEYENRPKHLLDFVRRSLIPSPETDFLTSPQDGENKNNNKSCLRFAPAAAAACARWLCLVGDPPEEVDRAPRIRCATELDKASVKFKKNKNPTSLTDIKFDYNTGVLTIPGLMIDHGTEIILRNLVAYEQFTDDYSNITEYAAFMDGFIDSREDVDLLQKNGIIETMLGDPTEVSRLFNNLLKDVAVPFWSTVHVRNRLEHYYNIRCHEWKASLMRNYFNSPWSFISLVAAITLLAFTFIQTFYAAIAYYHH